jgi:hypothetical protein
MISFDAGRLSGAAAGLAGWHQSVSVIPPPGVMEKSAFLMGKADLALIERDVLFLHDECERIDLPVTLAKLRYVKELLQSQPDADPPPGPMFAEQFAISYERFVRLRAGIEQTLHTLPAELSYRKVLLLPVDQLAYLNVAKPFGDEVSAKFPRATLDIAEASNCIAYDRPTAAVFHLMRVVEIAVKATGLCLQANQPNSPNWGAWLTEIKTRNSELRQAGGWGEFAYFQDIYNRLDAIKDAVRNTGMHAERSFSRQEARDGFSAVRSFMQRVAERMDENGEPKAP